MTYALGIDVGTTFSAAAVWRGGRAETVPLGNRANAVPSVVWLRGDGVLVVGDAAARRAVVEPGRVAREFKRRVGDRVPVMLADRPFAAEALLAAMVAWIVERVAEREGGLPGYVALTCPATWGEHRRGLLWRAAVDAGLGAAGLVVEPVAAAVYYASLERVGVGSFVGVYDLGGGTFDASVLRKTADGFAVVGSPEGDDRLGGVDFDQAVLAHVAGSLGARWSGLDLTDAATLRAVAQVRANAVEAKEALSSDTEVGVAVIVPGLSEEVRLTRGEFEGAIRLPLQRTVEVFRAAVVGAGLEPSRLHRVLLVGGSSRIPLVSQLLTQQLGVQVAVDAHPKYAVCLGAAIVAGARLATTDHTHATTEPQPAERQPATLQFPAIVGDDTAVAAAEDTQAVEVDLADRGLTAPQDTPVTRRPRPERPQRRLRPSYLIVPLIVVVAGASLWLLINRRAGDGSGGGAPRPDDTASNGAPLVVTSPSAAPVPDVIAFVSDRSGSPEVWTMRLDGADVRQVTDGGAGELVHPDWSPDGEQIVFASNATTGANADGDMEIWIVNADGTGLRQLTDNSDIRDAAPDWSPDGTRIAFSSQRNDGTAGDDLEIWIMNSADGQGAQQLTDNDVDDDTPDWSPDGRQIVWESNPGGNHDLLRMNADGSNEVAVFAGPGSDFWPMWSPDGDHVAYRSNEDGGGARYDIYTVTPEGGSQARLTSDGADNHRPNWSPDGRRLMFDKVTGTGRDLAVVPAEGGTEQPITDDPADDHSGAWRPVRPGG